MEHEKTAYPPQHPALHHVCVQSTYYEVVPSFSQQHHSLPEEYSNQLPAGYSKTIQIMTLM